MGSARTHVWQRIVAPMPTVRPQSTNRFVSAEADTRETPVLVAAKLTAAPIPSATRTSNVPPRASASILAQWARRADEMPSVGSTTTRPPVSVPQATTVTPTRAVTWTWMTARARILAAPTPFALTLWAPTSANVCPVVWVLRKVEKGAGVPS